MSVPGGGWGGFVWRLVATLVRAAGHEVFIGASMFSAGLYWGTNGSQQPVAGRGEPECYYGERAQVAVYYGVVKNNRVALEGDVHLADGVRVEVRPVDRAAAPADAGAPDVVVVDTAEAEEALLRDLLAEGLLEELPIDEAAPDEPFEPVTVRGRPLSEQIIEERR